MERNMQMIEKDVNDAFKALLMESQVVCDWKMSNEKEFEEAKRETIKNCFLFRNSKDYDPLSEAVYVLHFYGCVLDNDILFDDDGEVV